MVRLEFAGGIGGTVILGRDPRAGPAPMNMTEPPPTTPPPLTMIRRGTILAGRPPGKPLSGGRPWCLALLGAPVHAASRQTAARAAAERTAVFRARVPGGR